MMFIILRCLFCESAGSVRGISFDRLIPGAAGEVLGFVLIVKTCDKGDFVWAVHSVGIRAALH